MKYHSENSEIYHLQVAMRQAQADIIKVKEQVRVQQTQLQMLAEKPGLKGNES